MPSSDSCRIQQASLSEATRKTVHRRSRVSHYALRNGRERCIQTLKRLGADRGTNSFLDKAMILLTRYWAETPWNGRADLLQTADWLIRIGTSGFPPASPNAPP